MKICTRMAMALVLAAVTAIPVAAQDRGQENRQNAAERNPPAEQNESQQNESQQNQSQQDKSQQDQSQQDKSQQDKKTVRRLQVFELKHRDPQYLQQVIALRDGVSVPGHYGAAPGTPRAATAIAAGARIAGQTATNQNQSEEEKMVIAVSAEEKLMFVRGSEEQIQEVQTLVKALDVEESQLKAIDYANHRLIPIRSEKSGQVHATLTQLNLGGNVIRMGETTLLAFRTDEQHAEEGKQAEEVINKLGANPQSQAKSGDGEDARQKAEAKKAEGKKKADAQKKEASNKPAQDKPAEPAQDKPAKPAQDGQPEEADKTPTGDN